MDMRVAILVMVFAALFIRPQPGIAEEARITDLSIEACPVGLTEAGRTAAFKASAFFRANTDESGKITSWVELRVPDVARKFVDLDSFECCVHRWVLQPRSVYTITLNCGTTGEMLDTWSMVISNANGQVIRVVLPRAAQKLR